LKCPKNIDHKSYTKIKVAEQEQVKELIKEIEENLEPLMTFAEQHKLETSSSQDFVNSLKTKILDKKDQIINDFRQQLNTQTLELKELKILYEQTRKELIASKEAKQPDYQALKKDYEEAKRKLEGTIMGEISQAKQQGFNAYEKRLESANDSFTKKAFLKRVEKPDMPFFITNQINSTTQESLDKLLAIKQRIEEIPITQEVIVKQEKIIEVPKYVDKVVEKRIERPVIIDIDENKRLKAQLQDKATENSKLRLEIHSLKSELSFQGTTLKHTEKNLEQERAQNWEKKKAIMGLKTEVKTKETKINGLEQENSQLKTENKALLNAIERFLDIGIVKSTLEGTKTLLERFNDAIDNLKNLLSKKVEPKKELKPKEPEQDHGGMSL
jgi:regulator of replication initiation timing